MVETDTVFDKELLLYINAIFGKLSQMGYAYADKFPVVDEATTWEDIMGFDTNWEMVKAYVGMSTRLMFDPPASSVVLGALNETLKELEWRIVNTLTIKGGDKNV